MFLKVLCFDRNPALAFKDVPRRSCMDEGSSSAIASSESVGRGTAARLRNSSPELNLLTGC